MNINFLLQYEKLCEVDLDASENAFIIAVV
jgi:hypothetical protein